MHKLMTAVDQLLPPAKADEMVATLNADCEDDWSYKAVHNDASKYSKIAVYDEDGDFVCYM